MAKRIRIDEDDYKENLEIEMNECMKHNIYMESRLVNYYIDTYFSYNISHELWKFIIKNTNITIDKILKITPKYKYLFLEHLNFLLDNKKLYWGDVSLIFQFIQNTQFIDEPFELNDKMNKLINEINSKIHNIKYQNILNNFI